MREILFRGKRKDNGKWVYGNYAATDNNEKQQHFIFQNRAFEFEVDAGTVGQYTGLPDKNGEKIFEGDIIDFSDRSDGDRYGVIQYDSEETEFIIICDLFCEGLGRYHYSRNVEVIGNIYDHPELLR